MRGMKEVYLNLGFNDYLSKPIFPKLLDEIIVRWVAGSESKMDFVSGQSKIPTTPMLMEMESMRIDMLNHYRASFEITQSDEKFDTAYLKRFTSLIESLCTEDLAPGLKEHAINLIEAGQQGNVQKIREKLPAFYEVLSKRLKNTGFSHDEGLSEILPLLKTALKAEDSKKAGEILAEMATLKLDNKGRELYFLLYDLLYENNLQKAYDSIYVWERLKL
jgi:CheY-like chemotaxis protein